MDQDKEKSKETGKPVHSNNDGTERGYNEKNPGQPTGAFEPDAADEEPKPTTKEEVRRGK